MKISESHIPVFDGLGGDMPFQTWSHKIMVCISAMQAEGALEDKWPPIPSDLPPEVRYSIRKEREKATSEARYILFNGLSETQRIIREFLPTTKPAQIWSDLHTDYGNQSRARIRQINIEYHNARIGDTESVEQYVGRLRFLTNELMAAQIHISTIQLMSKVIGEIEQLPYYKTPVLSFLSKEQESQTMEAFLDYFMYYETSHPKSTSQSSSSSRALSAATQSSNSRSTPSSSTTTCQWCSKTGHNMSQCHAFAKVNGHKLSNGKTQHTNGPQNKGKMYCSFHKSTTHNTKDCKAKNKPGARAAAATSSVPDYAAAFTAGAFTKSVPKTSNTTTSDILMDSGATHHMTSRRDILTNFHSLDEPIPVQWGNCSHDLAYGMGDIEFGTKINGIFSLSIFRNVLLVPQLGTTTLISMGQIIENGGLVSSLPSKDLAVFNSSNTKIFECRKKHNLYHLDIHVFYEMDSDSATPPSSPVVALATKTARPRQAKHIVPDLIEIDSDQEFAQPEVQHTPPMEHSTDDEHTLSADDEIEPDKIVPSDGKSTSITDLWHYRLAHTSLPSIKEFLQPLDINLKDPTFCDICPLGKMKRKHFKQRTINATDVLQIIHSDLCGPLQPSLSKSIYILTFTDDYSRFTQVYFLQNKTAREILTCFQNFHTQVTTFHAKPILALHSDNGGEYVNKILQDFCTTHGIQTRTTASWTPQSNGVAERLNQTLGNYTRCMLFSARLPDHFWAEAVAAACHIKNMLLTHTSTGNFVPWKRWFKSDPPIKSIRVWGCPVYTKINKPGLTKLEERSQLGIFVGYTANKDLYRVYIPAKNEIVISRDLIFHEDAVIHHEVNKINPRPQLRLSVDLFDSDDEDLPGRSFILTPTPIAPPRVTTPPQPVTTKNTIPSRSTTGTKLYVPKAYVPKPGTKPYVSVPTSSGTTKNSTAPPARYPNIPPPVFKPLDSKRVLRSSTLQPPKFPRIKMIGPFPDDTADSSTGSRALSAHSRTIPIPSSVNEALDSPYRREWQDAYYREMKNLQDHNTWELVPIPPGLRALPCRWVLSVKYDSNNRPSLFKARLVVKGFHQREGIDYQEIESPVASIDSIRFLIAFAASYDFKLAHIDVTGAFLNGYLDEEVYICQPEGYIDCEHPDYVCKLQKSLYGLKQASLAWYTALREFLFSIGFQSSHSDSCLMIRDKDTPNFIVIAIYVDDILTAAQSTVTLERFYQELTAKFPSTYTYPPSLFIGISITMTPNCITLDQFHYIDTLLQEYDVEQTDLVKTPGNRGQICDHGTVYPPTNINRYRALVGALLWISRCTRPDIAFIVGWLGRFSHAPTTAHMSVAVSALSYLSGTLWTGLKYTKGPIELIGYTDSDFAEDVSRKSTGGYVFFLRPSDSPISWKSKLQTLVARSVTEAEYISCANGCQEATWLGHLLQFVQYRPFPIHIYMDNSSARTIAKAQPLKQRTKHIDVCYHYCRDRNTSRHVSIRAVSGTDNPADIFTKPFNPSDYSKARAKLNLERLIDKGF